MPGSKRVLVVDDDPDIRELLTSMLVRRELTVDRAAGGREALDLLRQNNYSVVLLDLMMPELDGFQVLQAIDTAALQPVVLVVTGADRSQLRALDSKRIHGIVRKPFDPDDLGDIVMQCAEIRSRSTFEAMAISAIIAGGPLLALITNR